MNEDSYSITEGALSISVANVAPDEERHGWTVTWTVHDGDQVWEHTSPVDTPSGAVRDQVIGTAASFLSAWCEAIDYQSRTGRESDNAGLFTWGDGADLEHVASLVSDDADTLAYQLGETD